MTDDPRQSPPSTPPARLGVVSAGVIYGFLAAAAFLGAWLFLDRAPLALPDAEPVALWLKALLGAGVGVAVFALDQVSERFVPLLRRMSVAMRDLLGHISANQALALALFSSVGEELFFRGFLQAWIGIIPASIAFGVLHIAPDKRLWPWPILAVAMGFAFGGLFEYTGDVLAPILAHFTINYFGLTALSRSAPTPPPTPQD